MVVLENILYRLREHPPRYGPEWGSGGVFGLKYYRDVLYYTLAFEAESHFITSDRNAVYKFELVGDKPVSGGDTYNAVEVVDDNIYFGGWVHAPAVYKGRSGKGSTISFVNKYSHVHVYDVSSGSIKLLWKEGVGDEYKWAGEVSDIIYDPVNDRLLLARGDGHVNLGIYSLDRRSGRVEKLSENPVLKGSHYLDHICFGIHSYPWGVRGVECIDLVEGRRVVKWFRDLDRVSIDGDTVYTPCVGVASSGYGRFLLFVKGGLFIGNPVDEDIEPLRFVRLFDFVKNLYGPLRTMVKPFGGGFLVAYNSYVHSFLHPLEDSVEKGFERKIVNTVVGPSVLVYITPPTARIVGVYGARITGFERVGDRLVIAYNTMANLGERDASPIDNGYRGFIIESMDILYRNPPPITFKIPGYIVEDKTFGGIPLTGYREPELRIWLSKDNGLYINSYDLGLPLNRAYSTVYDLKKGFNKISLRDYRDSIISLRFEKPDVDALVKINLL